MNKNFYAASICLICVLFAAGLSAAEPQSALRITQLRCEYQDKPLGIDVPAPRLSWKMEADERGAGQSAWQVLVSSGGDELNAGRGDLWDSGRVQSDQSLNIHYAGAPLNSGDRCYWKVRVWDKNGRVSPWSAVSFWEMGLLNHSDWGADWIGDGKAMPERDEDFFKDDPAPLFRKDFEIPGNVRQARLYISALGYYHAALNGRAVGENRLDPLWTRPDRRVFYSVYDVTELLREKGPNCLGVTLGNGWFNPLPLRMWGHLNLRERLPVGRPRFIARMEIELADGSKRIVTSDKSWKVTQGPVMRNSIYLGEKYDARRRVADWDKPGTDISGWQEATLAQPPEGALQCRPLPPIRITERIEPRSITSLPDNRYIIDMGQNFGGTVSFTINAPGGTLITMRYGELLYEDGTLNPMTSVCGQIKRKPGTATKEGGPPVAWQTDSYIAAGSGSETFIPRFTFHAFRYIELSGLPSREALESVVGLRMHSAVEPVGTFECSNEMFNRIQEICQRTFLSNIFGVQSDCPHRERFGYGGDLVVTSDAFMLNYDMARFYAKAVRDWQDSALPDGMLTDTAPSVGIQYCGVGWAMAHPHLLTQLYRYYGDRRIVEEQYAVSKRWLELVRKQYPDHIVTKGLHDHEALQKDKNPVMITPLYCESARMLAGMADTLGRKEDAVEYHRLAAGIKEAYGKNCLDHQTGIAGAGFQGSQVFALFLDMVPEPVRPAAFSHLLKDIEGRNNHLTTGIFGTRFILDLLSREGRTEVAYKMVNQRDFPGWGHMLEKGATTLWEHWTFSDNTYSHNHPMFGSVSQWFFNWPGGIQPAADAVGFDSIVFAPQFLSGLDFVNCRYESVRGPVVCNWKRNGDQVQLDLQVPVGSKALLVLPRAAVIGEGGPPAEKLSGVSEAESSDSRTRYALVSGRYSLMIEGIVR